MNAFRKMIAGDLYIGNRINSSLRASILYIAALNTYNVVVLEPNTTECTNGVLQYLTQASEMESTGGAKALQPQLTTWISSLVLLAAILN
ncbi:hypothetical protein CRM22_000552 [Opisthorchis felineus]|uniref:Uncharacterized protein n=1 Tax=Opisthorchis felineus TaxID=147828 RepID=A0A4S2MEH8_OPIFE|nr:hypothetical protein CRM22_000552 [Opisthorchis felineus]